MPGCATSRPWLVAGNGAAPSASASPFSSDAPDAVCHLAVRGQRHCLPLLLRRDGPVPNTLVAQDPWWAEHWRTCRGMFMKVRDQDNSKDTEKTHRGSSPGATLGNKGNQSKDSQESVDTMQQQRVDCRRNRERRSSKESQQSVNSLQRRRLCCRRNQQFTRDRREH